MDGLRSEGRLIGEGLRAVKLLAISNLSNSRVKFLALADASENAPAAATLFRNNFNGSDRSLVTGEFILFKKRTFPINATFSNSLL